MWSCGKYHDLKGLSDETGKVTAQKHLWTWKDHDAAPFKSFDLEEKDKGKWLNKTGSCQEVLTIALSYFASCGFQMWYRVSARLRVSCSRFVAGYGRDGALERKEFQMTSHKLWTVFCVHNVPYCVLPSQHRFRDVHYAIRNMRVTSGYYLFRSREGEVILKPSTHHLILTRSHPCKRFIWGAITQPS